MIAAKVLQFTFLGVGRLNTARKALAVWLDGHPHDAKAIAARGKSIAADIMLKLIQGSSRGKAQADVLKEDEERICIQRINTLRAYLRPLDMIAQTAPLIVDPEGRSFAGETEISVADWLVQRDETAEESGPSWSLPTES